MSLFRPYLVKVAFLFSLIVFTVFFMGVAFPNSVSKPNDIKNGFENPITYRELFLRGCEKNNKDQEALFGAEQETLDELAENDQYLRLGAFPLCLGNSIKLIIVTGALGAKVVEVPFADADLEKIILEGDPLTINFTENRELLGCLISYDGIVTINLEKTLSNGLRSFKGTLTYSLSSKGLKTLLAVGNTNDPGNVGIPGFNNYIFRFSL